MRNRWWRQILNVLGIVPGAKRQPYARNRLQIETLEQRLAPANRLWTGAVDSDWSNNGNWVGGAPTAADIAIFDNTQVGGTNADSTINGAFAGSIAGIDISNYTGTITLSKATLTIGTSGFSQADGTFTFGGAQTISIAGDWTKTGGTFNSAAGTVTFAGGATQTLRSGGSSFNNISHTGAATLQLSTDDLDVGGTFTQAVGASNFNANGKAVTVTGLTTLNAAIYLAGSGTQTFDGGLTVSGGTFTGAGGIVNATDVTLSSGTLTAPNSTGAFNVSGNWARTGGTFTHNSGTVTFDAAAGTQTLNSGGSSFNNISHAGAGILQLLTNNLTVAGTLTNAAGAGNLDANGRAVTVTGLTTVTAGSYLASTGTQTFNGGLTVNGGTFTGAGGAVDATDVTLSSGTLTAPSNAGSFNVSGNWSKTGGTFTHNGGTVTFDAAAGTQTLASGGGGFNNVRHSAAGILQIITDDLSVGGTLTNATGAGNFDANGKAVTVTGLTTVTAGAYLASTGTQTFNGGLTINGGTFTGAAGAVDAADVTLSSGTLTAPSSAGSFTVSGDWAKTGGTFTHNSGSVTFDAAAGTQTLRSGGIGAGNQFFDLVHSGAGTLQFVTNNVQTAGAFTSSAGITDINGRTVTLAAFTLTGGAVNDTNGTPGSIVSGTTYDVQAGSIDATLTGAAIALTKTTAGTVTLSGVNTYTGATTVDGGTLLIGTGGSLAAGSTVDVNNDAILGGDGDINGAVNVNDTAAIAPGSSTAVLDTDDVVFASTANFNIEINGTTLGTDYDQLNVTGTATLNGANLVLSGSFEPTIGNSFTILKTADGVFGTFAGLPQNGIVELNGEQLKIDYTANSNKNVVLSFVNNPTFDGTAGADAFTVSRIASNKILVKRGATELLKANMAGIASLTFNGGGGDDTLTVNYGGLGGFFNVPIIFHGEGQDTNPGGDKLVVTGGTFGSAIHTFTTTRPGASGTILYDVDGNAGTTADQGLITYDGLEPIDMTGSTITNLVFNLPGADDQAILEDDGAANLFSQIRSQNAAPTFDVTTFANTVTSVTVNMGGDAGALTVESMPDFTKTLTINGEAGDDTVSFTGTTTFAALTVDVNSTITNTATADVTVSGSGNANFSGSSVTLGTIAGDAFNFGSLTFNSAGAVTISENGSMVLSGASTGSIVSLTSVTGSISDDVSDSTADLTATSVTLDASTSIGQTNGSLDIDVATVTSATSATGGIALNLLDPDNSGVAVTLVDATTSGNITLTGTTGSGTRTYTTVDTHNGTISVTATAGNIVVGVLTAGTGGAANTVSVTATAGSITDNANDATADIIGSAATLSASTGIGQGANGSLDVNVTTVTSATSATGGMALNLLNDAVADNGLAANHAVAVTSATATTSGGITLTGTAGSGTRTYTSVDANNGAIDVSADAGDIVVGVLTAGTGGTANTVKVTATTGAIDDNADDATADIIGSAATLSASTGIGQTNGSLDLNVTTLTSATSDSGGIAINLLNTAVAANGLAANHAVGVTLADAKTSGNITLTGTAGSGTRTYTLVDANNGAIDVSAAAGNIIVGLLTAGTGGAANTVGVTATTGNITDDADDATADIVGSAATLSASTGIGQGANGSLDLNVTTVTSATSATGGIAINLLNDAVVTNGLAANHTVAVTSASATTSGGITLTGTAGSGTRTYTSVDTNNGAIDVSADAGNIVVGVLTAGTGGTANTVKVTATTGAIDDNADDATADIIGSAATLSASTGIGQTNGSLDLNVTTLTSASSATGGIAINLLNAAVAANGLAANHAVGVTLADATVSGGITLTGTAGSGTRTYTTVDSNNGAIDVSADAGNIVVGVITAGTGGAANTVGVTATAGSITDNAGDTIADIIGSAATLVASTGIGQGGNGSLDLNVATLTSATTVTGGIALNLLNDAVATNGLAADHAVTVTQADATTSGGITLTGTDGSGTRTYTLVDTNNGAINVSAAAGNIAIGVLTAGTGGAANSVTVTATTGQITDDALDDIADIIGSVASLTASTGIGQGANGSLDLNVNTVTDPTSPTGGIALNLLNDAEAANGLAADHAVMTSLTGTVTTGDITLTGTTGAGLRDTTMTTITAGAISITGGAGDDTISLTTLGLGKTLAVNGGVGGANSATIDAATVDAAVVGDALTASNLDTLDVTGSDFSNKTGRGVNITSTTKSTIGTTTISGNTLAVGDGAGILIDSGSLALDTVTISGNAATLGAGGGVQFAGGTGHSIDSSTIDHNTGLLGAGINLGLLAGTVDVTNSTVSTNTGNGIGVALTGGPLTLNFSTIARNTLAGVANLGLPASVVSEDSLFAENGTVDYLGTLTSLGHNLFEDPTGIVGALAGTDLVDQLARLAPLSTDYGAPGTTATHALLPGSAALDTGSMIAGVTDDQRGVARPQPTGGSFDIGAFESRGFTVTRVPQSPPAPLSDETKDEKPAGDDYYRTLITKNFVGANGSTPLNFEANVVALDPGLTDLSGGVLAFVTPAGATASATVAPVAPNTVATTPMTFNPGPFTATTIDLVNTGADLNRARTQVTANGVASAPGTPYFLIATASTNSATYPTIPANPASVNNTDWLLFNQKVTSVAFRIPGNLTDLANPQNTRSGEITGFRAGGDMSNTVTATLIDQDTVPHRVVITGESVSLQVSRQGTITDATNNGVAPIEIFSASHGLNTGDQVVITGVTGNLAANGTFTVTRINVNRFTLQGTVGSGDYLGGGTFTQVARQGAVADVTTTPANRIDITSPDHGLVTGDKVVITGVTGTTAANGTFTVTRINANRFRLQGSVGNGAYTGGGTFTAVGTIPINAIGGSAVLNGGIAIATTSAGVATFENLKIFQSRYITPYVLQAVYINPAPVAETVITPTNPFRVLPKFFAIIGGTFAGFLQISFNIRVEDTTRGSIRLLSIVSGDSGLGTNQLKVLAFDHHPTKVFVRATKYDGPVFLTFSINAKWAGPNILFMAGVPTQITMTNGQRLLTDVTTLGAAPADGFSIRASFGLTGGAGTPPAGGSILLDPFLAGFAEVTPAEPPPFTRINLGRLRRR